MDISSIKVKIVNSGVNLRFNTALTLSLYLALVSFILGGFQNCAKPQFEVQSSLLSSMSSPWSTPIVDPQNPFPEIPSREQNSDCFDDSQFDACIFWKSPVAQFRQSLPQFLNFGDQISYLQTFGVYFPTNMSSFENDFLKVYASPQSNSEQLTNLTTLKTNQVFKVRYETDTLNSNTSTHLLAQQMAYYWLNFQKDFFTQYGGIFYPASDTIFNNSQQKILVNAYADPDLSEDPNLENNAFYSISDDSITMGRASLKNDNHEMALSADVYLHEMGHANLYHASHAETIQTVQTNVRRSTKYFAACNSTVSGSKIIPIKVVDAHQLTTTESASNGSITFHYSDSEPDRLCPTNDWTVTSMDHEILCPSALGCYRSLHEGIADFHSLVIFGNPFEPQFLSTGETIYNDPFGITSADLSYNFGTIQRNPAHWSQSQWTVQDFFNASSYTTRTLKLMALSVVFELSDLSESDFQKAAYSVNVYDGRLDKSTPMGAGEVHSMGVAYLTILCDLYIHPKIKHFDFMKMFSEHLTLLNSSSNFQDALEAFLSIDQQYFNSQYGTYIESTFARRGVPRKN